MQAERDDRPAPPAHATGAVDFIALDELSPDETFQLRPDGDVSALATSLGRLGQLAPIEVRPAPAPDGAPGARWQVVAGFRRLAAVRLLARERVLARVHRDLSDADAWGLALAEALLHEPLGGPDLQALRERLRAGGMAPWAEELIDEALVRAPVDPELRERFHEFLQAPPAHAPVAVVPAPVAAALGALPVLGETLGDLPGSGGTPGPAPAEGAAEVAATVATEDVVEVTPEELVQDVTARMYALNQDLATACEAWEDLPVEGRRALVDQVRYLAALLPIMEAKE